MMYPTIGAPPVDSGADHCRETDDDVTSLALRLVGAEGVAENQVTGYLQLSLDINR